MVQNFRSALHGFNREDVVRFLEQNTQQHEQALMQKETELLRLRAELDEANEALKVMTEENARLHELIATSKIPEPIISPELEDDFDFEAPDGQTDFADPLEAPISPAVSEQVPPEENKNITQMELTAYRRAEMTERIARERANAVYEQVNNVFAQSEAKLTDAHQDMDIMAVTIQENLHQMETMLDNLRALYAETNDAFRCVSGTAIPIEE